MSAVVEVLEVSAIGSYDTPDGTPTSSWVTTICSRDLPEEALAIVRQNAVRKVLLAAGPVREMVIRLMVEETFIDLSDDEEDEGDG